MPIHEVICRDCGYSGEALTLRVGEQVLCPACGSSGTELLVSATSSLTGKTATNLPGPRDTGCCGSSPSTSGCAGPGTCCGKNRG